MFLLAICSLHARAAVQVRTADGVGGETYMTNDTSSTLGRVRNDGGAATSKVRLVLDSRLQITALRFDLSDVYLALTTFDDAVLQFQISWVSNANRYFDLYALIDPNAPADDAGGSFTNTAASVWNDYWVENDYYNGLMRDNWGKIGISGGTDDGSYVLDSRWVFLGTTYIQNARDSVTGITTTNPADVSFDALRSEENGYVTLLVIGNELNGGPWFDITSKEGNPNLSPVLILPNAVPLGASGPQPEDGGTVVDYGNLSQLCWSNGGIEKCEVWFGPGDANEVNYQSLLTQIAQIDHPASNECVEIPAGMLPLTAPQVYTWVVDGYGYPASDPNHTGEPNQLIAGPVWHFLTSSVPTVAADPEDQYKFPGESAVFTAEFESITPVTAATWYKTGSPDVALDSDDPYITVSITDEGGNLYLVTLTMDNLEIADDGAYYCIAENGGISEPTATADLIIKRQIAYWPFDGDAADTVNGYTGTMVGSPAFEAAGKVNQALIFDGTNDYVDLPDGFTNFQSGLTIAVWANPSAVTSWARFIDFGNGTANNILFARNGLTNDLTLDTADGAVTAAGVIDLNVWQWFAATVDESGNVVIYKNGLSVQTGTAGVPAVVTRTSNYIGESNWVADALYEGMMDEMRIYNYALSADDVAALYANVEGPFCRTPLTYDLDGDCVVGVGDLAVLAAQWMECGYWPSVCPPLP